MTVMTPLAAAIDQASGSFSGAYGPNLRRLQELKSKWDPDNLFRQNVNIVPRWDGGA